MTQPQETLPGVHQLEVSLRNVRPAVWRRLRVPSTTTLGALSDMLLRVFEWDGDHLHQFDVRGERYGPAELRDPGSFAAFFGPAVRDEDTAMLQRVAGRPGAVLDYTYDLGDDWRHRIEVEAVFDAVPELDLAAPLLPRADIERLGAVMGIPLGFRPSPRQGAAAGRTRAKRQASAGATRPVVRRRGCRAHRHPGHQGPTG